MTTVATLISPKTCKNSFKILLSPAFAPAQIKQKEHPWWMLIAIARLLIATPVPVDMYLVHLTARNSPLRNYLFCTDRPFLLFYSFPFCQNTARSTVRCSHTVCNIPVCNRTYPFSFPPVLYHSIFWSGREESGWRPLITCSGVLLPRITTSASFPF